METLTKTQKKVNRQFLNLDIWRTESEFRALTNYKGDLLNDAFKKISVQFHERLHRIKLEIIRGASHE